GDEIAVAFLHSVVRRAASQPDTVPKEVLKVVCNSLGSPEYFAATLFKHVTQQLAAELGIRTPVQQTIASTEAALDFARRQGYPVVLKSDFSWSGTGVKICRDERQLVEALPALLPPKTHPLKSAVRGWLHRDWYPTGFALSAQQFIQGRPAMYCLVAVAGEVLAGFAAIPEQTMSITGQSSVVRLVNHREMAAAASKLIQQFDYTGFAGFDFMLDADGQAYFLECNPRPIPVCHLGGLIDTDLCAALFTKMSGKACISSPVLEETLVTFFPQEWHRDPASHHLLSAHHDVPWDDPELLKACIEWQR
ncbi:MAG: ATP-grasp domain-containing protein, partial [Gemmatimonadaceae bacterium]|nr:ATP-grasp domain-containing protein [Gloeobacterales cyanobacterium ES-bin-141]